MIVLSLFSFSLNVNASDKVDKITISAAFEKDVDTSEIPYISIILDIIPANGNSAYAFDTKLYKENNYSVTINNKVYIGEVDIDFVYVYPDAGGILYDVDWTFEKIDDNNYVGKVIVKNKVLNTSSTANSDNFEDAIDNVLNNTYKTSTTKLITTTTTTRNTNSEGSATPGGDPVPEEEPTESPSGNPDIIIPGTTTTTTTQVPESTTTKSQLEIDKERQEQEAKERREREDLIFNIMITIIVIVVLIGLTIAGIKIYKASKLV